jgi:hypothetical protein
MLKAEGEFFSQRHFELALMARGAARASLCELADEWDCFARRHADEATASANKLEREFRT